MLLYIVTCVVFRLGKIYMKLNLIKYIKNIINIFINAEKYNRYY